MLETRRTQGQQGPPSVTRALDPQHTVGEGVGPSSIFREMKEQKGPIDTAMYF